MTKRQKEIVNRLSKMYADSTTALNYQTPFELLVAVILSAQCTDKRVNIITQRLFPAYNTPEKMAKLPLEKMEELIRDCGLYHAKAKNLLGTAKLLIEKFNSQVPSVREDLESLPGVGRKTASVVMSQAFGIPAIAVDTHVFRVSKRLGLASGKNVETSEQELMKLLPKKIWSAAHHWLIWHGRLVCKAGRPLCSKCGLYDLCNSADKITY